MKVILLSEEIFLLDGTETATQAILVSLERTEKSGCAFLTLFGKGYLKPFPNFRNPITVKTKMELGNPSLH